MLLLLMSNPRQETLMYVFEDNEAVIKRSQLNVAVL